MLRASTPALQPRLAPTPQARRRLLWAVLVSAALHVLVLSGAPGHRGRPQRVTATRPLAILLLRDPPAPVVKEETADSPDAPSAPALAQSAPGLATRPLSAPETALPIERSRSSTGAAPVAKVAGAAAPHVDRVPGNAARSESRDPAYYPARELDVFPALVNGFTWPHAPPQLSGGEAYLLLLVQIDDQGVVEKVETMEARPAGFPDDDARQALLGARFSPAQKNGRYVRSRVVIRLAYGEASSR